MALAATAAVFSALAASGALLVAILSYRASQPRVRVFLRLESPDAATALVIDAANHGRVGCTILRIGFVHGRRLLRREIVSGDVWAYGCPRGDGTSQLHRLAEFDATRWFVSRESLREALAGDEPAAVRGFVQLADGRLIRSKSLALR